MSHKVEDETTVDEDGSLSVELVTQRYGAFSDLDPVDIGAETETLDALIESSGFKLLYTSKSDFDIVPALRVAFADRCDHRRYDGAD